MHVAVPNCNVSELKYNAQTSNNSGNTTANSESDEMLCERSFKLNHIEIPHDILATTSGAMV